MYNLFKYIVCTYNYFDAARTRSMYVQNNSFFTGFEHIVRLMHLYLSLSVRRLLTLISGGRTHKETSVAIKIVRINWISNLLIFLKISSFKQSSWAR